jgi:hypothetical protein
VKTGFNKSDGFTIDNERIITQMLQQKVSALQKQSETHFTALNVVLYSPAKSSHITSKVRIVVVVGASNTISSAYARAPRKI